MMQVVSIFIALVLSGANVMVTRIGDNKKTAKKFVFFARFSPKACLSPIFCPSQSDFDLEPF